MSDICLLFKVVQRNHYNCSTEHFFFFFLAKPSVSHMKVLLTGCDFPIIIMMIVSLQSCVVFFYLFNVKWHYLFPVCHLTDHLPVVSLIIIFWYMWLLLLLQLSFQAWTSQIQETLNFKKHGDNAFLAKDFETAIDCYTQVAVNEFNYYTILRKDSSMVYISSFS